MTTEYIGMDYCKKDDETVTVLCGKRSGRDLKIYAIARTEKSPKCYLYGIVCLDKEEGDPKTTLSIRYTNLTYIRRRFRNISTSYIKG